MHNSSASDPSTSLEELYFPPSLIKIPITKMQQHISGKQQQQQMYKINGHVVGDCVLDLVIYIYLYIFLI